MFSSSQRIWSLSRSSSFNGSCICRSWSRPSLRQHASQLNAPTSNMRHAASTSHATEASRSNTQKCRGMDSPATRGIKQECDDSNVAALSLNSSRFNELRIQSHLPNCITSTRYLSSLQGLSGLGFQSYVYKVLPPSALPSVLIRRTCNTVIPPSSNTTVREAYNERWVMLQNQLNGCWIIATVMHTQSHWTKHLSMQIYT